MVLAQKAESVISAGRVTDYSREAFAGTVTEEHFLIGPESAIDSDDGAMGRNRSRAALVDEGESHQVVAGNGDGQFRDLAGIEFRGRVRHRVVSSGLEVPKGHVAPA